MKSLQFIMHCGIYHGRGYRQDKGWIYIKLATEDGFRAAAKQNKKSITVEGVVTHLRLISGRDGSLSTTPATQKKRMPPPTSSRRPGLGQTRQDLAPTMSRIYSHGRRLAERDGKIRKAIALYLAERAKNSTPRQREIAEKILKRNPLFSTNTFLSL